MDPRPEEPPLGVGESASVPSAAAIANAIFDATGVRFREPPFTPERILAGLREAGLRKQAPREAPPLANGTARKRKPWLAPLLAAAFGALGSPWRRRACRSAARSRPIARPDPAAYSAATIERGRVLAGLGGCIHLPHGAGRRSRSRAAAASIRRSARSTRPTSRRTKRPASAAGPMAPSSARCGRAIGRDGRHLFPAFPYPSFARASEADLQALYAFLMAQPPVSSRRTARRSCARPFGFRPLMAAWNTLFHQAEPFEARPDRDAAWNRGAYLVEGLGHCSACHSPRNALGAELKGADHLAGGEADGWYAPPLNGASPAPIPWTRAGFLRLPAHRLFRRAWRGRRPDGADRRRAQAAARCGHPRHGALPRLARAARRRLAEPELKTPPRTGAPRARASSPRYLAGARIYDGACAVCHEAGQGLDMFGVKPSLALNTAIHADNAGHRSARRSSKARARRDLANSARCPAFRHHFDDAQIAELAAYLRARFAPDKPAWSDLAETAARLRNETLTAGGGDANVR